MAPRGDCPAAAAGGAPRCDVHRVLGDLLSICRCVAVDRDGVPLPVRAADPPWRGLPRAAQVRGDARCDDSLGRDRRHLFRRRPDLLAPRDRGGRGGPGDRARQSPGARRWVRCVGDLRRTTDESDAVRDPDRPRWRRPHCGRGRRCVRRGSGARCCPGAADRALLRRLPDHHPPRRARPPTTGRASGDRNGLDCGDGDADRPRRRRSRPPPGTCQPRLARPPRDHVPVGRVPPDLPVAAASARRPDIDHPSLPAGGHGRPVHRPPGRGAVSGAAGGRSPRRRWNRCSHAGRAASRDQASRTRTEEPVVAGRRQPG